MVITNYCGVGFSRDECPKSEMPYSVQLIRDLVDGAGYSYSRIAYRIGVSPSTIHKLATKINRKPRYHILQKLFALHEKVFYGPYRTQQAENYIANKK